MERRSKAIAHRADQLEEQKTEVYIAKKRELEFEQQSVCLFFFLFVFFFLGGLAFVIQISRHDSFSWRPDSYFRNEWYR